ncbi:hypothetical protein OEZ85_009754 [Tetradesmus obliquus]|uniref:Nucleosome assembly protein n=1 Tax=Tetradesmus obliquus TaxID=3088 RepID=A0ABY8UF45_TETOB|nr:hypothetical protein OEZ85_009754 [Tetradesmus obliquus]
MAESLQEQMAMMTMDPEDFISSLTPYLRARVNELQTLQGQHDELEKAFRKERAALEEKYAKLYAPLYADRAAIVKGEKEVALPEGETAAAGKPEKGIPGFWATVLARAELVQNEKDADALTYLTDITCESVSGTSKQPAEDGGEATEVETTGFMLTFTFKENPYFTNTVLTKSYHMLDDDEPVLERSEGTEIDWKPGKNITVKVMKKKPKKGARPDAKPQTKLEPVDSFFNFFSPPQVPDDDADMDGEEMEQLHEEIEADYDAGDTIKTKLIPHAVAWFTGEALEDEGIGMFGDDDDEDEDEDDDDDDEAPPRARGGRGPKAAAGAGGAAGEQPQECKQQ